MKRRLLNIMLVLFACGSLGCEEILVQADSAAGKVKRNDFGLVAGASVADEPLGVLAPSVAGRWPHRPPMKFPAGRPPPCGPGPIPSTPG